MVEVQRGDGEGLLVSTRVFLEETRTRRGKQGTIQAVYRDGTLLTSTEEVVKCWKEHFKELLNPTNTLYDGGRARG